MEPGINSLYEVSMNPLEHHTFVELLRKISQEVSSSEGNFRMDSYYYSFKNYFKGGVIQKRWWHRVECIGLSTFITNVANEYGLFNINGIHVCLSCKTSEYVVSRKKLNGGTPTCLRCYSIYKGWGE